ncbi:MAG: hypothetical protein LBS66_03225 [Rhodospirillaceae bacterium]|jgi:hypothetical protein|nr:hypothetical protein [Rhodospirillaceae bacterium]
MSSLFLCLLFLVITIVFYRLISNVLSIVFSGRFSRILNTLASFNPRLIRGTIRSCDFFKNKWFKTNFDYISIIETRFLRMTVNHEGNFVSCDIIDGPFVGLHLSKLSDTEIINLYNFCITDSQSYNLLEIYLDRTFPNWRNKHSNYDNINTNERMSRQDACNILGINIDADAKMIKNAHRRLMIRLHPDCGGSNYLAAKINQAKDSLLKN